MIEFQSPDKENLEMYNEMGLTYAEMCTKFETHETPYTIKYYFKKYNIKHKSKSKIIDEFLDLYPFKTTKEVAQHFDVTPRLVNIVKSKKPQKTRAEMNFNYDTKKFSCKIKGHSGYATKGYDIVCAAISTLSCYVSNTLSCLLPKNQLHVVIKEDGYIEISCPFTDDYIYVMLISFKQHLEELENQYPNNVQVWVNINDKSGSIKW